MVSAEELHRFTDRHIGRQAGGLQLHADQVVQLTGFAAGVDVQDTQRSAIRFTNPFQAFQRAGLAGTVWPKQAKDFTAQYLITDPGDGYEISLGHERFQ